MANITELEKLVAEVARLEEDEIQFELELEREMIYDDLAKLKTKFATRLKKLKDVLAASQITVINMKSITKQVRELENLFENNSLFFRP
jgi:hypothetical protein